MPCDPLDEVAIEGRTIEREISVACGRPRSSNTTPERRARARRYAHGLLAVLVEDGHVEGRRHDACELSALQ